MVKILNTLYRFLIQLVTQNLKMIFIYIGIFSYVILSEDVATIKDIQGHDPNLNLEINTFIH